MKTENEKARFLPGFFSRLRARQAVARALRRIHFLKKLEKGIFLASSQDVLEVRVQGLIPPEEISLVSFVIFIKISEIVSEFSRTAEIPGVYETVVSGRVVHDIRRSAIDGDRADEQGVEKLLGDVIVFDRVLQRQAELVAGDRGELRFHSFVRLGQRPVVQMPSV